MSSFQRFFLLIASGILCSSLQSKAQYDMVWAFGSGAGLDFHTNPPKSIRTNIGAWEGAASLCDSNGHLLFYSEGDRVWSRDHQIMPNGLNLTGMGEGITQSTTQGVVIVPLPGSDHLYYLFSIGSIESIGSGRLWYSVVDMRLNNGLGDVVPSRKALALDKELNEKMIAVQGNDCNVWLLVVPQRDAKLKAYNIGLEGLDTIPVVSDIVPIAPWAIAGWMDVSPNRKKIFIDSRLYDFNADSGTVSNPIAFPETLGYGYGVCFSPDNSKLYRSFASLIQWDIVSNDSATIMRSKYTFPDTAVGMRRGPDSKIYFALPGSRLDRLGVIHQPNLAGAASQFDAAGIQLAAFSGWAPPNYTAVAKDRYRFVQQQFYDTIFCAKERLLQASANSGIHYVWNTGDTARQITVTQNGVYWVHYEIHSVCTYDSYTDTFHVYFDTIPRWQTTYVAKELYCPGDTLILRPTQSGGNDYTWHNGSAATTIVAADTGMYWVQYRVDSLCSMNKDSFAISYTKEKLRLEFDLDTLVCTDDALNVKNLSDSRYSQFRWHMGNGTQMSGRDIAFNYPEAGTYTITVYGQLRSVCIDSTQRIVTVDAAEPLQLWMDQDSICAGQSIRLRTILNPATVQYLQWQLGEEQLHTNSTTLLDHAFPEPGIQPIVLSARFRACPDVTQTDSVYVAPLPLVFLGRDTSLCFAAPSIVLFNRHPRQAGELYTWNTGDTSTEIHITQAAPYQLQVRNSYGCIASESIEVGKDCYTDVPNVFSPNDDGINDYFFPRHQLSQGITGLHFQIRNRWGQLLFENREQEGGGWDGRNNGQEQPTGVYIYQLRIQYSNGHEELLQGNVTLLR